MTETPPAPQESEEPVISFKLAVTLVLAAIFAFAVYMVYSGATGTGSFRKICDKGKGKVASRVLGELSAIGGEVGEPSENGTVIVQHSDGPRCVLRVTNDKVFSALYED